MLSNYYTNYANTTGKEPQGANDYKYPVANNTKHADTNNKLNNYKMANT